MLRIQPNPDSVLPLSRNLHSADPVETHPPARQGHLLLIGGGFKPLEVLNRFVELAGGG